MYHSTDLVGRYICSAFSAQTGIHLYSGSGKKNFPGGRVTSPVKGLLPRWEVSIVQGKG